MLCKKCGKEIKDTDLKCPYCNEEVKKEELPKEKVKEEVKEVPPKEEAKENPIKEKKPFNKKLIIIPIIIIILVGLALLIYFLISGREKLRWDETYKAYDLTYVTQSKIKLGIKLNNLSNAKDVTFTSPCGKIEQKEEIVTWDLNDALGECEITAKYKNQTISKKYTVISKSAQEHELVLEYEIDYDSDEDLDFDNLTNKQEKEYKTDPLLADTDLDGLDDDYEILTSKTDPLKVDTDDDGLSDYDEITLKLDPLKADSKGDGIKDGERELTYNYQEDNLELTVTGKGNIASTIAEVTSNTKISSKKGLINNLYTFYTEGNMTEAIVKIKYTDEELTKYGLKEDELSLYYFNPKTSKYEKVPTTIDKKNKILTAKLTHFSQYVVGDQSVVKEESTTQILFVLDNSWSMYSNEQYEEIEGKEYYGGLGSSALDASDADGVRFTLTGELSEKLIEKGYKVGLSEFRADYANILPIGASLKDINSKLSSMNGKFVTLNAGTNINNALTGGIKDFKEESDNKYIIVLTDGIDGTLKSHADSIIAAANKANVSICSVGFGKGSENATLSTISNSTGCRFFSSSDVNGLTELFDNINSELNNNLVDVDGDNEVDGILIADSGFVVNKNGFSFQNYSSDLAGGHCFGMATFAELYYMGLLPLSSKAITSKDDTSYAYNLSYTYFKNYSELYGFKLKTNALKYGLSYDLFDEEPPSDYRYLDGDTLKIKDEYKKEIKDSGLYEIKKVKSSLSKKEQIAKNGVSYKDYETVILSESALQSSTLTTEEKNLFNAIYASFIKQYTDKFYLSSSNLTTDIRNLIGTENSKYIDGTFINILKARLSAQDPLVLSADFSIGLHAINAIKLVQDIDNPNHYYIYVYDNNYPGEQRYIELTCKKGKCYTKANEYYSKNKQPIRVTPSVEYDLAYFKGER